MPEPESTAAPLSTAPPQASDFGSHWQYIAPFGAFIALTSMEGQLPTGPGGVPSPVYYPIVYALKIATVSAVAWWCRSTWRDLRPWPSPANIALSAVVGLLVIVAWVGLDGHYPALSFLGKRTAFDPGAMSPVGRVGFLAARLFGLVLVVPLIEELFYRSFLMRWIEDPTMTAVPIGKVTPLALAVTTGLFTFSHPEWLPALLTSLAWGWLLWQTKSVSACVFSHAVANLALGVYVLTTHDWKYW